MSNIAAMRSTLLVVDDHDAFRGFATRLLAGDRFSIAGVAGDGETALSEAERLRPDLVLLDIQLPGIDGFEVARRLAQTADPPEVILTSTRDAQDYGARLREAPVVGFVPKHRMSVAALSALLDAG